MPPRRFSVPLNLNTLQGFRAAHAIAEAGVPLQIPRSQVPRWKHLDNFFLSPRSVRTSWRRSKPLALSMSHELPIVTVGNIELTLLFPAEIVKHLENGWPQAPGARSGVGFRGLLTPNRLIAFRQWSTTATISGDSTGRHWPRKAWDSEYYDELLRLEFVLCPNGDFVWTYRFFEAILCGAIPVVEEACDAYRGFRFALMNHELDPYSADDAKANLAILKGRCTLSAEAIRQQLGYVGL